MSDRGDLNLSKTPGASQQVVDSPQTTAKFISVVGAGLAGSECAWQLAEKGHKVRLYEMRSLKLTPAHKTADFAELVCSNSFGSLSDTSATGQLKWEAKKLNSLVLSCAVETQVPAGQALGVDREKFAAYVSQKIRSHSNIEIIPQIVNDLNDVPRPAVIATGPLTDDLLSKSIQNHFGQDFCYFFDAIAPIIDTDSINMDIAWKADRYDKGTPDYINCPLNKDEYNRLIEEIEKAQKIEPKYFETTQFFEGCMPIETMVQRGPQTLRFGPMKPVGLTNPRTGRYPWAAVQLRMENKEATAYNMVGFQTRMSYSEQVRVFRLIPGLENAEFLKLGSIHRNLYVNSPMSLSNTLASKQDPRLYFAGQITGVEGYFESTCIGILVARFIDESLKGKENSLPPRASAFGSLLEAITEPSRAKNFQPTNINFSLLPKVEDNEIPPEHKRDKSYRKTIQIKRAQESFLGWL